ncbi:MAG: amino acid permease [Candidatus Omnitrophota bacterium]
MEKLKKDLNLVNIFSIASGAMISSGIFILPSLAYAQAGPAVVVSYFIAGLLAMTGMFSQAELVSAMPKAGGTYFYVTRSMGSGVGTVDGLITWFSLSLKSAFALVGMAAFGAYFSHLNIQIIAVGLCLFFIVINLLGVKEAGVLQNLLVFALLAILIFYVARAIPEIRVAYFDPFMPKGWTAVFSTAGLVFVSFGGLLKVASVAEEVKDPARTVPLGMILSIFIVGVIYLAVVFVTTGVLGPGFLKAGSPTLTPISDAAEIFLGGSGRILLNIAAILAFVSTANAGIMAASRYPLALSRDGLLPIGLAKINARFKTPHIAILLTGIFMIIGLFLKLEILVKVASTVLILTYIFSCCSVVIMRESHLQNYQPRFRAPLYPWIQIAGIIGFGFLLLEMGREALITSVLLVIGGFFVYWFYGRIRTTREYALLRLLERITARELTSHLLESELKEIIRERDEITKDRFDHIIEKAVVLDIVESLSLEDLFHKIAGAVNERYNISFSLILDLLYKREKESSTAISPYLAIPHIVIKGEGLFDIILIRSKNGVSFSKDADDVCAIFVLIGTTDERNFHLRALASIAQIVQSDDFYKKWMKARNKHELRDLILLGERRRYNEPV